MRRSPTADGSIGSRAERLQRILDALRAGGARVTKPRRSEKYGFALSPHFAEVGLCEACLADDQRS